LLSSNPADCHVVDVQSAGDKLPEPSRPDVIAVVSGSCFGIAQA
jgi:hypothetical protein